MSTYDQNIANLKANNRRSIQEIKTYNTDVARFESAKFQRQGELWMLAGELGKNYAAKIQANREKDEINESIISDYETLWQEYEKSDAAKEANAKFEMFADNQNQFYDNIRKLESDGLDSNDAAEGKMSTGKGIRMKGTLELANLHERFPGWKNNQRVNSDEIFFATIDNKLEKIQVNDRNLSYKKELAVHKHLTKKYLKINNIDKYSRDFLYLPKERGGSGFMKSILETNQAAFKDLETRHKIELSEKDIALATSTFSTLKTSTSLKDLINSIGSGYDNKGKLLNYAGAWKRLNEKILPSITDAGLLPPDQVLKLGENTFFEINGKKMSLADWRSDEWGAGGKWHRKALEAWKNKGTRIKAEWDFKTQKMGDNTLKLFKEGKISKTDLKNFKIDVLRANAKGNKKYDFTEMNAYINSKFDTQEEADIRARELIKDFNTNGKGWRLEEILKAEDIRVQNSTILADALAEDKRLWGIVDEGILQMRENYQNKFTTADGEDIWTYKSSDDYRKWKAIEGYAVRYKKQNPNANVADVWDATKKYADGIGDGQKINAPYHKWDAIEEKLANDVAAGKKPKADLEEFQNKRKLPLVKDNKGKYPNLVPQQANIEISKEDEKELAFMPDAHSNDFLKMAAEAKFADPDLVIPEEQAIFKNEKINYNKLLDKLGYIDLSIVDIAAEHGLTTAEFLQIRQKANGKLNEDGTLIYEELKPEYMRQLNHLEMTTLPSAMKNRILGKVNDGQYTPETVAATVAQNSFLAGAPVVMTFGDNGEEFVQAIGASYKDFADSINDKGDFTLVSPDDGKSGKTLFGIYAATAMSLDNKVFNDFTPGGANVFVETIKENLNEDSIASMVTDPKFGFDAYSAGGIIEFLPVVDSLKESKGKENLQTILDQINKYLLYTPDEEGTDLADDFRSTEDDNTSELFTDSTTVIEDTLNKK